MILRTLWYLICLGVCIPVHAQDEQCDLVLTGIVLDEHDASTLGYATIYIPELDRGVVTDSIGNFSISNLCAGTYTLRISHVGCETREEIIRIKRHLDIVLHLEHHAELLETIELHAERVREVASASRVEVSRETLLRSTGRPLGDILENLPGVTALQTGPNVFKPVIHGLHSQRILILKDGLRLESQQWGLDHAPEIDPNYASRISVVKGAAAVQYGADAVGGVILVESEELPADRSSTGSVRIAGVDNGRQIALAGSLTKGLGKGTGIRVQGAVRRAGDAYAADYLLTNTGIAEANVRAGVGYTKGLKRLGASYEVFAAELGILRSAHIGNLTDLEEALQRDRPLVIEDFSHDILNPKQIVLHHTARVSGQTFSEGLGVLSGQYAIQWNRREEYDIRRGGRDDIPALDLNLTSHTGLISLAHEPLGDLRGKVSLHWNYQLNENVAGTGVRPLIPDYQKYMPALSLVEKWVSGHVELEGGIRYEYVRLLVKRFDAQNNLQKPEFTFHNVSGSVGMRYAPSQQIAVSSHLGYTRRAPHVHELFSEGLHHGAAAIEEGDSNMTPENALKWVTGLDWEKKPVTISASAYVQSIRDFIYLLPAGEPRLTIRGAFPVFEYTQDDAVLYGGDLMVSLMLTKQFELRSEMAILRARNISRDAYLFGMPSDRMRHMLVWRSADSRFDAEFGYARVWEQTRAPETGDYAPPPPGYGLVHLSAGVHFMEGRMDLHFAVRNALNVSYREYLNRLRYYADDTGRSIEIRLSYIFL